MSPYWKLCLIVACIGVLASIGSAMTARSYRFQDGMVRGVIGRMGSGKSLFIVAKVLIPCARAMSRRRGLLSSTYRPVQRIIANFEVDTGYDVETIVLDGNRLWDHLLEIANEHAEWNPRKERFEARLNALVVIDEAHLFITSGKAKMAQKAAYICSMARKMNAEIWWLSQSEMKIHKRLRDDSAEIWRVGRWAPVYTLITGPSRWFVARAFESERIASRTATPIDRRFYRMSRRALRAYDSFELIVPDAEVDLSRDELSGRNAAEAQRLLIGLGAPPVLDPSDLEPVSLGGSFDPPEMYDGSPVGSHGAGRG